MLRLFQIEWLKVKTYRAFWVLFGAFLILFPLALYFASSKFMEEAGRQNTGEEAMLTKLMGNPFEFPRVWLSSSYFGGIFFIILGMLFILLITNEVQYRTHRQNIIDGWSRFDFLKAKFTMLLFFVIAATLVVFVCGLWIGMIYTPSGKSITDGIYYVGYFVIMAFMYLMVAFLIAIFIKRTGLSIIIYFAFVCIIDNFLWLILTLRKSQVGYFLPLESTDSLVSNPFKPSALEQRTVDDSSLLITAAIYIIVFSILIKTYFQKIDLKT